MIGEGIEGRKPIPLGQVSEILEKGKVADPTYEQQVASEHAKKFGQKASSEAKMLDAIRELKLVSETSAVKVAELRPQNLMMLKQIMMHEKKAFTEEDYGKLLAITKGKE
jgi:DNA-directed RNA polymerase subunit F